VDGTTQGMAELPHAVADVDIAIEDSMDESEHIMTTFRWPAALGGKEIAVIGSFTDWAEPIPLGKSSVTGDFVRTMALRPGAYQYKYLVDGVWKTSPCDATTKDDEGQFNNHRLVSHSHTFSWKKAWGGKEVFVAGDFAGWTELIPLHPDPDTGDFSVSTSLQPGVYSVQYLVDGQWMLSPIEQVSADENGHHYNKTVVNQPDAFRIFYATGWRKSVLSVRITDAQGNVKGWQDIQMQTTSSRATPMGGSWMTATIPSSKTGRLEFTVAGADESTGSLDDVDKPLGAECYVCPQPGGYKLESGHLKPFRRATEPPMMLVSDLDGTMVGDTPEFDAATDAFSHYWEDNSALANSVLVYNTGRSVGAFISLLQEKKGMLAVPDVLITAVGTKVWLLDDNRHSSKGDKWKEDKMWAHRLDEGWDLIKARAVGDSVVSSFGNQIHWLDNGSEHPHRVAFSVDFAAMDSIIDSLKAGFATSGVQARIITSGTGGWRYVDCVSIRAGKLEALEYVRTLYGVPKERCVAAGDSGNDILMLEGENRALVVGNAQPELQAWLINQPQNDRIVYTDSPGAAGIIEGLARLGLY